MTEDQLHAAATDTGLAGPGGGQLADEARAATIAAARELRRKHLADQSPPAAITTAARTLALVGVDVYETEPIIGGDHPLLALDNALCTPHLGYVTSDEWELQFRRRLRPDQRLRRGLAHQRRKPRGTGALASHACPVVAGAGERLDYQDFRDAPGRIRTCGLRFRR